MIHQLFLIGSKSVGMRKREHEFSASLSPILAGRVGRGSLRKPSEKPWRSQKSGYVHHSGLDMKTWMGSKAPTGPSTEEQREETHSRAQWTAGHYPPGAEEES